MALRAIRRRALRSALTALTAAVAVATVFATRALLRGSETALERDLARLGVRTISVVGGAGFLRQGPGALPAVPLGPADAEAAREALRGAGVAAEVVEARVLLATASRPGSPAVPVPVPLVEAPPAYFRTFEAEAEEGRLPSEGADREGCLVDRETARALGGVRAGEEIVLRAGGEERRLRVAGVLADPFRLRPADHAPDLSGAARPSIYQVLGFRNVYVAPVAGGGGALFLLAVVERREEASRAHDALERALRAKERGLVVWSRGTWVRSVMELFSEQIAVANLIWGIVLAVALVLVATVTLVGVRERVAEVAVRRAEGATRAQVTGQLLAEGAILALAGGIAGVPAGAAAAELLAGLLTWRPHAAPEEALLAAGLGTVVGLLSAALPAWKASRWSVVEGLRRGA
jgi:hypothetical protein